MVIATCLCVQQNLKPIKHRVHLGCWHALRLQVQLQCEWLPLPTVLTSLCYCVICSFVFCMSITNNVCVWLSMWFFLFVVHYTSLIAFVCLCLEKPTSQLYDPAEPRTFQHNPNTSRPPEWCEHCKQMCHWFFPTSTVCTKRTKSFHSKGQASPENCSTNADNLPLCFCECVRLTFSLIHYNVAFVCSRLRFCRRFFVSLLL